MPSGLRSKECKDTMNPWGLECFSMLLGYISDRYKKMICQKNWNYFLKFRYEHVTWYHCCSTLRSILLILFLMYEYFIHMPIRIVFNPYRADCFGIFFYFSFCLLLYCMVLYLDALVGGCYCQKWPSKNVNSYNWLLVVIKGLFIGFDFWTTDFSL